MNNEPWTPEEVEKLRRLRLMPGNLRRQGLAFLVDHFRKPYGGSVYSIYQGQVRDAPKVAKGTATKINRLTQEGKLDWIVRSEGTKRGANLDLVKLPYVRKTGGAETRLAGSTPEDDGLESQGVRGTTDLLGNVRELLRTELEHADQECVRTCGKTVAEIYVDRELSAVERPPGGTEPEKRWDDVLAQIDSLGAAVVFGEPGSGKTVALLREVRHRCGVTLAKLDARAISLDDLTFAVYVQAGTFARALAQTSNTVLECGLQILAERYPAMPPDLKGWISEKLERGQILLAIDALDEVGQHLRPVLDKALTAAALSLRRCPMLFSTRRIDSTPPPGASWPAYELSPFTTEQMETAIGKWISGEDYSRLREEIEASPPMAELMRNPMLLMLACQNWASQISEGSHAPRLARRCDFYRSSVKRFYGRWEERAQEAGRGPDLLEKAAFPKFVEEVAWRLWRQKSSRDEFSGHDVSWAVDDTPKPSALSARRDLLWDMCEAGLLINSTGEVDGPYRFLHRTFLEFLTASHLKHKAVGRGQGPYNMATAHLVGDPDATVILWMLAGQLDDPAPLLDEIVTWARRQLELPRERSLDAGSIGLARIVVDCMFECRGRLSGDVRDTAWNLITRGLDRRQRQTRRDEWKNLADWSLVYKALTAVDRHEGVPASAHHMLNLLISIRASTPSTGAVPGPDQTAVTAQLSAAYESPCPTVRWCAVWATGALSTMGGTESDFSSRLVRFLEHDDSDHVRSVACRVLVQIGHPDALPLLETALEGERRLTAAGAAIGLGRLGRKRDQRAIRVLKRKARVISKEPPASSRDPLPIAVIGALEAVIDEARRTTPRWTSALNDEQMALIFESALSDSLPLTRGTAASALGKMGRAVAWDSLKRIVEQPDNGDLDLRTMRGSAAFACDQLCSHIAETKFPEAVSLFRGRLRDNNEAPQVRRPSASAMVRLIRRGYSPDRDVYADLQQGAKDSDSVVARNCLLALLHTRRESAVKDVVLLVTEFDSQRRKLVCEAIKSQPTKSGLAVLSWILEQEDQADIVIKALSAIEEAYMKGLDGQGGPSSDFIQDMSLIRGLVDRCLTLTHHQTPVVVEGSLDALRALGASRLPVPDDPSSAVCDDIAARAGVLLKHVDEGVAASARSTLGAVSESSKPPASTRARRRGAT